MNDKTNYPRPTPAEVTAYAVHNDESSSGTAILGFGCLALIGVLVFCGAFLIIIGGWLFGGLLILLASIMGLCGGEFLSRIGVRL